MRKFLLLCVFIWVCLGLQAQNPEFSYASPQFYKTGKAIPPLTPITTGGHVTGGYHISTLAGDGSEGSKDAAGLLSSFNQPCGIVADQEGNLYVADQDNHKIRKISKTGIVTTFAGNGQSGFKDGNAADAEFYYPMGLTLDKHGNLYVADTYNHKIRKISANGIVTTLAGSGIAGANDGTAGLASFNFPWSVTVDASDNVYVADFGNCTIRKITSEGLVSTYAGDGSFGFADGNGTAARFNYPTGITVDTYGNLYITDRGNNRIRKITTDQSVTTLAGNGVKGSIDGPIETAEFNNPYGITTDSDGNLYITDSDNNTIRKITQTGIVSTIAGNGSLGNADGYLHYSSLNLPTGITIDDSGSIFITDQFNETVRKITNSLPYSISPELPSGLYFDTNTGEISGTPTTKSPTTTYTITGVNDFGSYQTKLDLTVYEAPTLPIISTQNVTNITASSATGNGTIESLGIPYPTSYGICWNTTGMPTIDDQHIDNGSASVAGPFTSEITGIAYNTTYYARAYATNEAGTSYGDVVSFSTYKSQLNATPPVVTLSKLYDGTTTAEIDLSGISLLNLDSNDQVTVSATATYDNKNVGKGKKITVMYQIAGIDSDKYIAPVDYVFTNGEITPKTLEIHASAQDKVYDGNKSALVSELYPVGIIDGDLVKLTINDATFSDKNAGTNKPVTFSGINLSGTDAGNYTLAKAPSLSANITKRQLAIESTQVTTNKMYDGNATANIVATGNLQNVVSGDNLSLKTEAIYDSPEVGINKIITVSYTLTGSDLINYIAPDKQIINGAKISDIIVLQALQISSYECGARDLSLNYTIQRGTPTQYKIIFNDKALAAGFTNIAYDNLLTSSNNGVISLPIPTGNSYGNYSGTLVMRNELGVESVEHSFNFTINISADNISTKFNDVILIRNLENDFTSYQWYKNGELINGATNQFYCDPDGLSGTYYLEVTTRDGSKLNTCPTVISKASQTQSRFIVFPNPVQVNQACTIMVEGVDQKNLENADISIFNSQGKLVYHQSKVEKINTLNLSLPGGVYIGQTNTGKGSNETFKIVITN